jgi:hypothetical protein
MAEFVEASVDLIQQILADLGPKQQTNMVEMPVMHDLDGFPEFLQELKNAGMHPYIMGDFPATLRGVSVPKSQPKPYVIK